MTHNTNSQPFATLHSSSQTLREQTLFAHRQAATRASCARKASKILADLDVELAFRQLRQMVALVGGKQADSDNTVVSFAGQSQAAE